MRKLQPSIAHLWLAPPTGPAERSPVLGVIKPKLASLVAATCGRGEA